MIVTFITAKKDLSGVFLTSGRRGDGCYGRNAEKYFCGRGAGNRCNFGGGEAITFGVDEILHGFFRASDNRSGMFKLDRFLAVV